MTATYTGRPGSRNIDAVRVLIQDTSTGSAVLQDEEIQYFIDQTPHLYLAAAEAAGAVAGHYAGLARVDSKKVGDLQIVAGDAIGTRVREYRNLADTLRRQAAMKATPFSGGISVADKDLQEADTDYDRPFAALGMHDNPASTST